MTALAIDNLVVRYGTATALDGIDLAVAQGEILVLLGGSGSGKTTLLRALGGFLRPAGGRIILAGADITAEPPHRRPVNTMFQSYALFPHMDVAANIGFGLRRAGLARAEIAARVDELLALVRLEGFAHRRVTDLSGGQQQRVALARSLAPRPALLLLDEPFSALDRSLRDATRLELVALLRRFGTTAILVTHDQQEALATADRLAVLERGRIVQAGPPEQLYERPAGRFVAEFLGAANILPARFLAAEAAGAVRLDVAGHPVRAQDPQALGAAVSLIALRPERLRLLPSDVVASDVEGAAGNILPGTVRARAYEGAFATLFIDSPAGPLRLVRPLDDGLVALPAPGEACRVGWSPAAAILLPG